MQNGQPTANEATSRTTWSRRLLSRPSWCATRDSMTPKPSAAFGYQARSRAGSRRFPTVRSEIVTPSRTRRLGLRGTGMAAMDVSGLVEVAAEQVLDHVQSLGNLGLVAVVRGSVVPRVDQLVGEVLLGGYAVRRVVRVHVRGAMAQLGRARVVGVSQVGRDESDLPRAEVGQGAVDRYDDGVRLRRRRGGDRRVRQVDPRLRHADQLDGLGRGHTRLQDR